MCSSIVPLRLNERLGTKRSTMPTSFSMNREYMSLFVCTCLMLCEFREWSIDSFESYPRQCRWVQTHASDKRVFRSTLRYEHENGFRRTGKEKHLDAKHSTNSHTPTEALPSRLPSVHGVEHGVRADRRGWHISSTRGHFPRTHTLGLLLDLVLSSWHRRFLKNIIRVFKAEGF